METESVMDRTIIRKIPKWAEWGECLQLLSREAFDLSQGKSIRGASAKLNISATSIQRILQPEPRLFPYKIQVVQKLEPQDYDSRVEMCETLLDHFQRDPSILEQMWFSDKALFHLSGCVNRHNTRIWGLGNSVQIHVHERDTPKLIIWCAISSASLIGPFFFRDREGHSVNVNGIKYIHMLQEFCVSELSAIANMQHVIFQQKAPQRIIWVKFMHSWMSSSGSVAWSSWSCEMGSSFTWSHTMWFFLVELHQLTSLWNKASGSPNTWRTHQKCKCFSDSQNVVRCWSGMRETVAWLLRKRWCTRQGVPLTYGWTFQIKDGTTNILS